MKIIYVDDKMQNHYSYQLDEPMGKNFDADFQPAFSPAQMLALGVFEGHYLNDCQNEFPKEWFSNARLSIEKPNIQTNCFKIKSRQSLQEWQRKGWIYGPDPRGWFQWYCRYYMGRRIPALDRLQINRWKAFKRHKAQLDKNCPPSQINCRIKQRQALLQWAYNPINDTSKPEITKIFDFSQK